MDPVQEAPKVKIKFTEARQVVDHAGRVVEKFRAGQVVELSDASARHWLNRNAAEIYAGPKRSRSTGAKRKKKKPPAKKTSAATAAAAPAADGAGA